MRWTGWEEGQSPVLQAALASWLVQRSQQLLDCLDWVGHVGVVGLVQVFAVPARREAARKSAESRKAGFLPTQPELAYPTCTGGQLAFSPASRLAHTLGQL